MYEHGIKLFLLIVFFFFALQTACADGVVRVFKLDDVSSKSFKYVYVMASYVNAHTIMTMSIVHTLDFFTLCRVMRVNLPAGGHPTAISLSDDASAIVVATHNLSGSSLYMYGEEKQKSSENKPQAKLPLPEIRWEHHKVHDQKAILTLFGTTASYGTADGSTLVVSCSEGIYFIFCASYKIIKSFMIFIKYFQLASFLTIFKKIKYS